MNCVIWISCHIICFSLLDRAHLRDIRDRSVLRLFEATDIGGGVFPGAMGVGSVPMPAGSSNCSSSTWDVSPTVLVIPTYNPIVNFYLLKIISKLGVTNL